MPRSRLAEAVREIREISARHDVPVFTIAHAADGNLHPIIVVDPALGSSSSTPPSAGCRTRCGKRRARSSPWRPRLGGTLTGEHGVGVLKRQWVAEVLGPAAHAVQRRIKEALDPRGILNPGKAL